MSALKLAANLRALGLIIQADHLRDEPPACYLSNIDNVGADVDRERRRFLAAWRGPQSWIGSRRQRRAESAAARNLDRFRRDGALRK